MFRHVAVVIVLSLVSTIASTQQNDTSRIIAVNVASSDPRIQQMLPGLRDQAAKVVEESAKNVRAVVVLGVTATPEEEARQNSADYLLTIELNVRPSVRIPVAGGPENGPSTTADVPRIGGVPSGITHSRCPDLLGEFTFSYSVISVNGKHIKLHDSHTLRESEYPLGPQFECLEKLSTRAVGIDASAAVHKLKSKKAL